MLQSHSSSFFFRVHVIASHAQCVHLVFLSSFFSSVSNDEGGGGGGGRRERETLLGKEKKLDLKLKKKNHVWGEKI